MAHMIDETTGKAAFASTEPAWHGLGTIVKGAMTAEEVIELADLNWTVEKKPIQVIDGPAITNRWATVRTDTNAPLGVVGKSYEVMQNKDAFKFFDSVVNDEKAAIYETAGSLDGGRRIWIMAAMPNHISVRGTEDIVKPYMVYYNGHDGMNAIKGFTTFVRPVCHNTVTAGLSNAVNKVSIIHTPAMHAQLKEAHKLLGITNQLTNELQQVFDHMAGQQLTSKKIDKFFEVMAYTQQQEAKRGKNALDNVVREFNRSHKEGILEALELGAGADMPTCKGTVFGLYNAWTFYYDHMAEYRSQDSKLKSIWDGAVANKRQKAMELMLGL